MQNLESKLTKMDKSSLNENLTKNEPLHKILEK